MTKRMQKAACIIITERSQKQVLLIKREDFRIWALPAGGVDGDEDWEDAAIREAREETGLHIQVDDLVGEYTQPQFADIVRVYAAHVVGGSTEEHGWEAVDVQWFPLDALPRGMPLPHYRYLDDWRDGDFPIRRILRMPRGFVMKVRVLVFFRNIRNRVMGLP